MKLLSSFILIITAFLNISLFAQNFWIQTNGPYSSRTNCIAFKRSNNLLITGTNAGGGVYVSSNYGSTWNRNSSGLLATNVRALSVTPDGVIYAGTYSDFFVSPYYLTGINRSTDNGNSWQPTSQDSSNIVSLASNSHGDVFAVGFSNVNIRLLWRSTNNGVDWVTLNTQPSSQANDVVVTNTGVVYASFIFGLSKSTDNGNTFTSIVSSQCHEGDVIAADSAGNVYTAAYGLYRSHGDSNWVKVLNNDFIRSISVAPNGYIYAGDQSGEIYKSTNSGTNWVIAYQVPIQPANPPDLTHFTFDQNGNVYAVFDFLGVLKSTDNGQSWTRINEGLTNGNISSLSVSHSNKVFAGTWNDGLFFSTDRGNSWTMHVLPNYYISTVGYGNNGYVYEAGAFGPGLNGMYRSTNDGMNWVSTGYSYPGYWINKIISNTSGILFGGFNNFNVIRSSDNGSSWTTVSSSFSMTDLIISSQNVIWVMTSNGLRKSTNNGDNWTRIDSSDFPNSVISMTITHNGVMIVSANQKIYHSTDNGTSWQQISNISLTSLVSNSIGYLYGLKSYEPYQSTDGGYTWNSIDNGLIIQNLYELAIDSSGYLYAGSGGSGVYRSLNSTVNVARISTEIPSNYILFQNYPNPFNPETNIRFQLPKSGLVTLKIYNLAGQEIGMILNENLEAGEYSKTFNAEKIASGVYFYKLTAGSFVETKKMALIK